MPCCGILLSHRRRGPGPHGHRRHGCRGAVSLFADLRWQHVAVLSGAFLRSRRQFGFLRLGVGVLPKGGPGVAFRWFGPCSVNVRGLS